MTSRNVSKQVEKKKLGEKANKTKQTATSENLTSFTLLVKRRLLRVGAFSGRLGVSADDDELDGLDALELEGVGGSSPSFRRFRRSSVLSRFNVVEIWCSVHVKLRSDPYSVVGKEMH